MKIKISYQDGEAEQAQRIADLARAEMTRTGRVRIKEDRSALHDPFKHIYIADDNKRVKNAGNT